MRISLRFPSVNSLSECFNRSNRGKHKAKKLPLLDEQYMLGSETAGEVLYRRIRPEEIAKKGRSWKFWAVTPLSTRSRTGKVVISKKGILLRELKGSDMVKWGTRRHVKYLARNLEDSDDDVHYKCVKEEEDEVGSKDDEEEEDEDKEEEEEEEEEEKVRSCEAGKSSNGKRKLRALSERTNQKKKRPKLEEMNQQIVVCSNQKNEGNKKNNKKVVKYIARWSLERYKLAEKNMLKIMKEVGALFGNPILRPELRAKARRLIGDTGLLDHLLKHMAGKVAPGGQERFRRRHNLDGAMEYWLEKADLVDIRREAGVQDPYWTPPPGWVPGDSPAQDPLVAREIKELKEDVAKLKM